MSSTPTTTTTTTRSADQLQLDALKRWQQGDYKRAEQCWVELATILERDEPNSLKLAEAYKSVAFALDKQNRQREALLFLDMALELKAKLAQPPGSFDLASKYFERGCQFKEQNALDLAQMYLERALRNQYKQRGAVLTEEDEVKLTRMLHELGDVAYMQKRYDAALKLHRTCMQERMRKAPNSLDLAISYHNVACVLEDQGDKEQALAHYLEALQIREIKAPDSHELSSTYHNLGLLCRQQPNMLPYAFQYTTRALEIEERQPLPESALAISNSYLNLAMIWEEQGDSDLALEYFNKAVALQKVHMPRTVELRNIYQTIGYFYEDRDKFDEAIRYLEQALAVTEETIKEARVNKKGAAAAAAAATTTTTMSTLLASACFDLGRVHEKSDQWSKARHYLSRTLELREKLVPNSAELAETYYLRGGMYVKEQTMLGHAIVDFQHAIRIWKQVDRNSDMLCRAYSQSGTIYDHTKQFGLSRVCFGKAIAIQERIAPQSLTLIQLFQKLGEVFDKHKKELLLDQDNNNKSKSNSNNTNKNHKNKKNKKKTKNETKIQNETKKVDAVEWLIQHWDDDEQAR